MRCWTVSVLDRALGVNQQYAQVACFAFCEFRPPPSKGLIAAAAGNDLGAASVGCHVLTVLREAFSASYRRILAAIASAFDVNGNRHQRFPPIWPLVQRLPRE